MTSRKLEPAAKRPVSRRALVAFGVLGVVVIGASAAIATLASRGGGALAVATVETGPGDPAAVYAKGQAVDIYWANAWWPGVVTAPDGNRYLVHYEGYGKSSAEWVTARRLRPRTRKED